MNTETMPTGIDAGASTLVVATSEGTTSQRNAIVGVESATLESDDQGIVVETDDGTYAVGDAAFEAGDDPPRLLGGGDEPPGDVVHQAVERFLSTYADEPGGLRYAERDPGGADPLAAVATDLGYSVDETDPGMAVCYDVLAAPVTGIGIAVLSDLAVATLAVGGVAVATARVDPTDDWYALDDVDGDQVGDEGMQPNWFAGRYETLVGDLAAELSEGAPIPDEAVPVAVGGDAAPKGIEDRITSALAAELPIEVGSVTLADRPALSLARGSLVAADADEEMPAATPVFAEEVPHEGGIADYGGAVTAIGGGVARAQATTKAVTDATRTDGKTDDALAGVETDDIREAVASAHGDLATLERRGAQTVRALSGLIRTIEEETGDSEQLERLQDRLESVALLLVGRGEVDVDRPEPLVEQVDTLQTATDDLQAELGKLEAATASADLGQSLKTSVEDLKTDVHHLQSVITSGEGDVDIDVPESGGGVDAIRLDTLEDDLGALDDRLSEQVESVWSELDDVSSELVDITATIEGVPGMEQTVQEVRTRLMDLNKEVDNIWEGIGKTENQIDALENRVATTKDVDAVQADLESVTGDLRALRSEFERAEWADPGRVDRIEANLEGLRETLGNQAERIQQLEREQSNLDDRIETVFQNSAKSEALASVQTEVSRVRQTANEAKTTSEELEEIVTDLQERLEPWQEELETISAHVDNLAGQSVTRQEMNSALDDLEYRVEDIETRVDTELGNIEGRVQQMIDDANLEGGNVEVPVVLLGIGLFLVGGMGAFLAMTVGQGYPLIAGGFLVLSATLGLLAWLTT